MPSPSGEIPPPDPAALIGGFLAGGEWSTLFATHLAAIATELAERYPADWAPRLQAAWHLVLEAGHPNGTPIDQATREMLLLVALEDALAED
jgi:hypothetical protein